MVRFVESRQAIGIKVVSVRMRAAVVLRPVESVETPDWTLTPYRDQVLTTLRAISKGAAPAPNENAEAAETAEKVKEA